MKRILLHGLTVAALVVLDPHIAPAQEQALTGAYNASGQELFRQFAARPGNIVFSPYSIGTAMAMALSGARGETAAEMAKVLRQTLPRPEMESANGRVIATLNGYDKSAVPPTCPTGLTFDGRLCKGPLRSGGCPFPTREVGKECTAAATFAPSAKLLIANALMITKSGNLAISPEYAALLKDKYSAEIFRDIKLATVNDWVKRKTEGKIDKILDKLDENSAAILLNAVYFKSAWALPFVKSDTKNAAFSLTATQKADVPTMHRIGSFAAVSQSNYRAIRLPYTVRSLGLIVVVPEKVDGVREVGDQLTGELPQLLADLRAAPSKRIALAMPRFKTSYKADLVSPFKTAGMRLAFEDKADFSGMTGPSKIGLKITSIVHRAVIEVDEEGTEAAAATAIVIAPTSMPAKPDPFLVDRPFLFYLVDDATGAVLFQGRIMDPRQ